mgnify:CR=1 FL=1
MDWVARPPWTTKVTSRRVGVSCPNFRRHAGSKFASCGQLISTNRQHCNQSSEGTVEA